MLALIGSLAAHALTMSSATRAHIRPQLRAAVSAPAIFMTEGLVEVTEDWTTSETGLQYLDLTVGSGDSLSKGDVVKVEYTGWTESTGTQFDSSVGRAPIAFAVGTGRVIPGWDEGILGMKVGGRRKLSIPAELAYGEAGAGADIPPNARIQFDCTLVSVESGFAGFLATFPGGVTNLVLVSVLALSFVPYFVPEEVRPAFFK